MVWKDVVGYEAYFQVSDTGQVYSKRSGKILALHLNKQGRISLSTVIGGRDGKKICFKVHRLVAEAFIENPASKPQVNHIDGCPTNNNVSNLEWATPSENIQHAHSTGLIVIPKGVKNKGATLTKSDVEFIRLNPNNETIRELGIRFGVHHCTIVRCKNLKRYMPE